MERRLAISSSVFTALLRAYPADFRQRFGAEMTSVFAESGNEAYERWGMGGLVEFWFIAAYDLLRSVFGEHASRLVSTVRQDFCIVSHSPAFAAACGAVAANLCFAVGIVVVGLHRTPNEQFFSLATPCVSVAVLWAVNVLFAGNRKQRHNRLSAGALTFRARMAAFRHLAMVAMVLLLGR